MKEIDTIITDVVPVMGQSVDNVSHWNLNYWFAISMVELLFILLLLFLRSKLNSDIEKKKFEYKSKALNEDIDFSNVLNSAFHADEVYNQMKGKCHPDKFATDPIKNEIALDIFQQMTKYKNDIRKLEELKKRAIDELDVTF